MEEMLPIFTLAFISGIGTSMQPCLFPLLPTYFSFMVSSDSDKSIYSKKLGLLSGTFISNR